MTISSPRETRPPKKGQVLSRRQRTLLHRLLHRDIRKCSSASLAAFTRQGWVHGWAGGYELTEAGRRVAEQSELAPQGRDLVLEAPSTGINATPD